MRNVSFLWGILCIITFITFCSCKTDADKKEKLCSVEALSMIADETASLDATDGCVFSSEAPEIAKVAANGTVTALAEGKTFIVVKNGNNEQKIEVEVVDHAIENFDIRNQTHLNWSGRTIVDKSPNGKDCVMFPQSYSSFGVAFYGSKIIATIYCRVASQRTGQKTYFKIKVDARTRTVGLNDGVNVVTLGDKLKKGKHRVTVTKLTEGREAIAGLISLSGESADGDFKFVKPWQKPNLKLEFYGDSLTVGHGVKGSNATSAFETKDEDPTLCYSGVATELLGAEANFFAYSGMSLAIEGRFYSPLLLDTFDVVCNANYPNKKWDFSKYIADVVIINIGANDWSSINYFYSECKEEKIKIVKSAYVDFINKIKSINPTAKIVCVTDKYQIGKSINDAIEAAAAEMGVYSVELYSNGLGSASHPDSQAGEIAGKQLADFIRSIL